MMADALRQRDRGALPPWLSTHGVSTATAIEVSRNNFCGTLVNALRTSFPAVGSLVGEKFFDGAATSFARDMPPRSPWLDSYGASFPAYLDTLATLAALPYIAEVAKLEWLINLALHAPDAHGGQIGTRDIETLTALDNDAAGSVRLHPAPSFGLLRTVHPADAIWSAVLALDADDGDARLAAIDLQSGPVWLCVSRQADGVDVRRMPERAWRFAAALRGGATLATAASDADSVDGDIGALLAAHLQQQHFTSFSIGT